MKKLNNLTIKEIKEGLSKKRFSSVELTEACLSEISRVEADWYCRTWLDKAMD